MPAKRTKTMADRGGGIISVPGDGGDATKTKKQTDIRDPKDVPRRIRWRVTQYGAASCAVVSDDAVGKDAPPFDRLWRATTRERDATAACRTAGHNRFSGPRYRSRRFCLSPASAADKSESVVADGTRCCCRAGYVCHRRRLRNPRAGPTTACEHGPPVVVFPLSPGARSRQRSRRRRFQGRVRDGVFATFPARPAGPSIPARRRPYARLELERWEGRVVAIPLDTRSP